MTQIERVCGWCGFHMGWAQGTPNQAGQVTHGMCDQCKANWDRDLEAAKAKRGAK